MAARAEWDRVRDVISTAFANGRDVMNLNPVKAVTHSAHPSRPSQEIVDVCSGESHRPILPERSFPGPPRPTRHNGGVTTDPTAEVTVVNGQAWTLRPATIAQLVGKAAAGAVIADPAGRPAIRDWVATITDPHFWSTLPAALAEALATSPTGPPPISESPPRSDQTSRSRQAIKRRPRARLTNGSGEQSGTSVNDARSGASTPFRQQPFFMSVLAQGHN